MSENRKELVYAGLRKAQKKGDSIVFSIPKREVRESLDVDPDQLASEQVTAKLFSDGSYELEIPSQAGD